MAKLLKHITLVMLFSLIVGCEPFAEPQSAMDEYIERLARVLKIELTYSPLAESVRYPSRRQRVLAALKLEINLLDFLALHGCELQVVVAERNAILGRVMQPLIRLGYEIRFIEAAKKCYQTTTDEKLRLTLETAIAAKTKALPHHIWNATFGSDEMAQLLSPSAGYYPITGSTELVMQLANDLQQLNNWLQHVNTTDLSELSSLSGIQQRWQYGHRAGQLVNSAQLVTVRLNQGSALIAQRIEHTPICPQGRPTPAAKRMQSLFFKIYIAEIQPYLSAIDRSGTLVFSQLDTLALQQKSSMPVAFVPFYQRALAQQGPETIWQQFSDAVTLHTERWQDLLQQCGMRPQA